MRASNLKTSIEVLKSRLADFEAARKAAAAVVEERKRELEALRAEKSEPAPEPGSAFGPPSRRMRIETAEAHIAVVQRRAAEADADVERVREAITAASKNADALGLFDKANAEAQRLDAECSTLLAACLRELGARERPLLEVASVAFTTWNGLPARVRELLSAPSIAWLGQGSIATRVQRLVGLVGLLAQSSAAGTHGLPGATAKAVRRAAS
jgi:hypothetical protein